MDNTCKEKTMIKILYFHTTSNKRLLSEHPIHTGKSNTGFMKPIFVETYLLERTILWIITDISASCFVNECVIRGTFSRFEASPRRSWRKKTVFSIFFKIVLVAINEPSPSMLKHCDPIMEEEGRVMDLQQASTIHILIVVSKMATRQMGFGFRKKSDGV